MGVVTTTGTVNGRCSDGFCSYYAVPYAMPPVGDLRFSPPQPPPASWQKVSRDSTKQGKACWQTPYDDSTPQSEDCLHINVYSPTNHMKYASSLLPVIVFFYGGGALSGANNWYDLSKFASRSENEHTGPAVVFVPNYRVGPLGFLATSELSSVSSTGASGNYGLMDCAMAMEWVQKNAAAFGGDPQRVTAMGQSSGGTMVWGLLANLAISSENRGALFPKPIFKRALILSGSPNISMARSQAELQNTQFASTVGCEGDDATAVVECLRHNVSAAALSYGHAPVNTTWQANSPLTWGTPGPGYTTAAGFQLPGITIVDGAFMPVSLKDAMGAEGAGAALRAHGVAAVLASNVGEESDLCPTLDFGVNATDRAPLARFLNRTLAHWMPTSGGGGGGSLLQRYYRDVSDAQQAYLQLSTHIGTTCGQLDLMQRLAMSEQSQEEQGEEQGQGPALYFTVVAAGPSAAQELGVAAQKGYESRYAYHMFDLLWATEQWNYFAQNNGVPPSRLYTPSSADREQARLLRKLWIEFAKGGTRAPQHGLPLFDGPSHLHAPAENNLDYVVGLIGKSNVTSSRRWKQGLCNELKEAGLWEPFWWSN